MPDDERMPSWGEIDELVDQIKPLLRDRGAMLQGAALCDVVAMYFAGHNPIIREEAVTAWIETMRTLIPVNEKMLIEHYGKDVWSNKLN